MLDQLTPDETRELRELLDIEKIRKLKLLYSQLMDSRDIDALVEILSEDAVCEFGPEFGGCRSTGSHGAADCTVSPLCGACTTDDTRMSLSEKEKRISKVAAGTLTIDMHVGSVSGLHRGFQRSPTSIEPDQCDD